MFSSRASEKNIAEADRVPTKQACTLIFAIWPKYIEAFAISTQPKTMLERRSNMKFLIGLLMISLPTLVSAGHHEDGKISKAAKSGQLMVVYHWPCENLELGLKLLNEMITYESDASPYPYSAVSAVHEDGALASIDVHSSTESFEKAAEWQNNDSEWQRLFMGMAGACGSADDLTAKVLNVR